MPSLPYLRGRLRVLHCEQKCSGTATYAGDGSFRVELRGPLAPGLYTVLIALYLSNNYINPDIHMVPYQATSSTRPETMCLREAHTIN
jgi:hypothetical protein